MTMANGKATTDDRVAALEHDVREVKIGTGAAIREVTSALAEFRQEIVPLRGELQTLKSVAATLTDELTKQRAENNRTRSELASVHEAVEVRRWWVTLYRSEETRRLIRHLVTAVVAILGSRWLWGAR